MSTVKGFNTTLGVLKYDAESLDNYNTPLFDSTSTYEVGDYVIEDGKLYRCITDVPTAGSWSSVSSNFVAAILTDDIKGIKEDVDDLSTDFSTLEGNVGTLGDNVQTLSNSVGTLSTDVNNLTTSVGKINNSIALPFSTSTSYAIGDYVLYGGSLYRFTAAHAAGAWTGTDAVQVQLAENVADLKSQINTELDLPFLTNGSLGKIVNGCLKESDGTLNNSTTRLRTDYLTFSTNQLVVWDKTGVASANSGNRFGYYEWPPSAAATGFTWSGWKTGTTFSMKCKAGYKYLFMFGFSDNRTVNPSVLEGAKFYSVPYYYAVLDNYHGDGFGVFANDSSESEGVAITDKGEIELAFFLQESTTNKCLFDTTGFVTGSRFYLDIETYLSKPNSLLIKVGANNERHLAALLTVGAVNWVKVTWDGTTDPSNKVYSIWLNGEFVYSTTYTGTVSGTAKIKNEGSWKPAHVQWLYFMVNGTLDRFATGFDLKKSNLPVYYATAVAGNSILKNYPKTETEGVLANTTRTFRIDSTSPSAKAPLTLLWCSDIHENAANTSRLKTFWDAYSAYFDDAIHTGDVTTTYAASLTFWEPCKKFLQVVGNHEYFGEIVDGERLSKTPAEVYTKFIAPYKSEWTGATFPSDGVSYFYKDYSTSGVRLIVLDYKEIVLNESSTQMTWLASVLAETLDNTKTCYGYTVVIAVHAPAFLSKQNPLNPFDSIDIKSSVNGVVTNAIPTAVSTFIGNGGKFACYLTGHTHTDHFGGNSTYPNQLNISVGTASDAASANTQDIARVSGTKSQDLFNVISIDTHSECIKLTRFGAEYDRQLRHKKTVCYYYGHTAFDAATSYAAGNTVLKDDKLYQFIANHSAGAWTGTDAIEVERLIAL